MSVTQPSDAANAGMAKQIEGRRCALSSKSPPSVSSSVGWLVCWLVGLVILLVHRPVEMEQSIPKRRHIQFRRRAITQKKEFSRLRLSGYTVLPDVHL